MSAAPVKSPPADSEFEREASAPRVGFIRKMLRCLSSPAAYWIIPIIFTLLMVGLLLLIQTPIVAPFIFPLF